MIRCEQLNLRGWKLLKTEKWEFEVVRLRSGRLDIKIGKAGKSRGETLGSGANQRITVKVHSKIIDSDTSILARSIYFFNHRQPTIQLWKDCAPDDLQKKNTLSTNIYDIKEPWWQSEFHCSVKIDDKWFRLEDKECFSIPLAHRDDNYNVINVILLVSRYPEKEIVDICTITK